MLRCQSLSRRVGERWLIRDISLQVEGGKILGIVGPSGSGKTTLVRLLALLDMPDGGIIEFADGIFSPRGKSYDGAYPGITFVAQSYPLWPHLTLRAMRTLVVDDKDGDHPHWETLGLETLLDRIPIQLSAGQRQRAALALTLSVRPKVLILDEITSAQDVEHCEIIAKILRLLREQDVTIILSSHYLQFVSSVADQFCFLDGGRLIEAGPIAHLREPTSERLKKFLFVVG